jgi:hypothetical protein
MNKYIVVGNNTPLDTLLKSDFNKAVQRAEYWSEYLRTNVNVLEITGSEVKVALTIFVR